MEMATHSSVLAWRIPGTAVWWAAVYGVAQSWTRLKQFSSSSSSKLFQLQVYTMVLKVKETKNQFYENKITRLHFKIVNS